MACSNRLRAGRLPSMVGDLSRVGWAKGLSPCPSSLKAGFLCNDPILDTNYFTNPSRGLSAQALKVLTILHNFDLQRPDGTTAAQRLFGHPFPDLFESVLSTFTDLPMPRRSSLSQQPNPWHSQIIERQLTWLVDDN